MISGTTVWHHDSEGQLTFQSRKWQRLYKIRALFLLKRGDRVRNLITEFFFVFFSEKHHMNISLSNLTDPVLFLARFENVLDTNKNFNQFTLLTAQYNWLNQPGFLPHLNVLLSQI